MLNVDRLFKAGRETKIFEVVINSVLMIFIIILDIRM